MNVLNDLWKKILCILSCFLSVFLFTLLFYATLSILFSLNGNIVIDFVPSTLSRMLIALIISFFMSLAFVSFIILRDLSLFQSAKHLLRVDCIINLALLIQLSTYFTYNNSLLFSQFEEGWPYLILSLLSLTLIAIIIYYLLVSFNSRISKLNNSIKVNSTTLNESKKMLTNDSDTINEIHSTLDESISNITDLDNKAPVEIQELYNELISSTNTIKEQFNNYEM